MPVHEIKYRAWEGELLPAWRRLLSIPRFSLMSIWNKWIALLLMGMGLIQMLAYTGYLLLVTNPIIRETLDIGRIPEIPSSDIFRRFYIVQMLVCFLVVLSSAPRLMAPELSHRALPILYSRPITKTGYIFGKFLGVFALLSYLTWIQTTVLFIFMLSLYPEGHVFWQDFWSTSFVLWIKATILGLLMSVSVSFFALGICSISKNIRFSVVMLLTIFIGSSFITFFIQDVIYERFPDLGLRDLFYSLGILLFDNAPPAFLSVFTTLIGILLWTAAGFGIMLWRLRPVEIYKE